MSREIKFRFWDINKNEMISHESINKDHAYRYIYREDYREFILPMQFTGLKDKNGIDIYESDILKREIKLHKNDSPTIYFEKVIFKDASFKTKDLGNSKKSACWLENYTYHTIEIIGNTHENPELLTT